MEKEICRNCAYYYQHYALNKRKIYRVFCGHCVRGRSKIKKPNTPACDAFTLSEPDESAFVNKEYLSKELMRYMMNLELLPEIEKAEALPKKDEN